MAFFSGRAEQHDDQRGEQRDDRVADRIAAEEDLADQPEDDRVDRGNRRQRRGVDQRALDDDLDVHQPVADDRRREGQRHEAEQHARVHSPPGTCGRPSANGSA